MSKHYMPVSPRVFDAVQATARYVLGDGVKVIPYKRIPSPKPKRNRPDAAERSFRLGRPVK